VVVAVWSVKGGVGVSSVAAMLALAQVERAEPSVLIDLCGDIPALLGMADLDVVEAAPGMTDWCKASEPSGPALGRIERAVRNDLTIVARGTGSFPDDATALLQVLRESQRHVVVDCGLVTENDAFRLAMVRGAATSLLVVRECFLNLRAAQRSPLQPTGVVVLKEPGRQLGRADVEAVTGVPVVAQIAVDAGIARSIDAGLATARLPRGLLRSMGRVPAAIDELRLSPSVDMAQHAN